MQDKISESGSLFSTRKWFRQEIRWIMFGIKIGSTPFIFGYSFSHKVVCNTRWLLLQCGMWLRCICQYRLIISKYISGTIHRNSHHSKFVPETTKVLTALLHCNKFRTKGASLNRRLLLWEPMNGWWIQISDKTTDFPRCYRVQFRLESTISKIHHPLISGSFPWFRRRCSHLTQGEARS